MSFEFVTPPCPTLFISRLILICAPAQRLWQLIPCSGTTASSAGSDFQLQWQGPSHTDDQVLSCAPGPCPTLPRGFKADIRQQGYVPSLPASASRRRAKHVKERSVLPAWLHPAAVKGGRPIPISTAEGLQSTAAQPPSGSRAAS